MEPCGRLWITAQILIYGSKSRSKLVNAKPLLGQKKINNFSVSQLMVASDVSLEIWGDFFQGRRTRVTWPSVRRKFHVNVLELKASTFTILTLVSMHPTVWSIHLTINNIFVLWCLVKMGGIHSQVFSVIGKEICDYLLTMEITITAE